MQTVSVEGLFYRAVDPAHRHLVLSGSRSAGRYSRPDQPTLYLSSSVEGVKAAMIAHRSPGTPARETLTVEVEATDIVDLREPDALEATGVSVADAVAPWQPVVEGGGTPISWLVRDAVEAAGAHGLIDPSRKRPGLWHLVLFTWNVPGAPTVTVTDGPGTPPPRSPAQGRGGE